MTAEVTGSRDEDAGVGWSAACTLPVAERPARFAEFDGLFADTLREVRRAAEGRLRLRFGGGADVGGRVRDLTEREALCCSFFDFAVERDGDQVIVDVRVPPGREPVLDGLTAKARAALAGRR